MSSMRKRLKMYLDFLTESGCSLGERSCNGKHMKQTITYRGKTRWVLISVSPSDRREFLNWKTDVKRLLRELEHGDQF